MYSLTGCDMCQWLGDYFMLDLFPQSQINMYTTEINILCVLLLNQQFRINRIDKYKHTLCILHLACIVLGKAYETPEVESETCH